MSAASLSNIYDVLCLNSDGLPDTECQTSKDWNPDDLDNSVDDRFDHVGGVCPKPYLEKVHALKAYLFPNDTFRKELYDGLLQARPVTHSCFCCSDKQPSIGVSEQRRQNLWAKLAGEWNQKVEEVQSMLGPGTSLNTLRHIHEKSNLLKHRFEIVKAALDRHKEENPKASVHLKPSDVKAVRSELEKGSTSALTGGNHTIARKANGQKSAESRHHSPQRAHSIESISDPDTPVASTTTLASRKRKEQPAQERPGVAMTDAALASFEPGKPLDSSILHSVLSILETASNQEVRVFDPDEPRPNDDSMLWPITTEPEQWALAVIERRRRRITLYGQMKNLPAAAEQVSSRFASYRVHNNCPLLSLSSCDSALLVIILAIYLTAEVQAPTCAHSPTWKRLIRRLLMPEEDCSGVITADLANVPPHSRSPLTFLHYARDTAYMAANSAADVHESAEWAAEAFMSLRNQCEEFQGQEVPLQLGIVGALDMSTKVRDFAERECKIFRDMADSTAQCSEAFEHLCSNLH